MSGVHSRLWKRGAGLALSVLLALGVVEGLARHHAERLSFPGDGRRFASTPAAPGLSPHGFREPSLLPEANRRRVVVLGDSMTYGTTSAGEAWPAAAEVALGPPWRLYNLSHYGYDAEQSLAVLQHFGWGLEPALVVFAAYPNDLVPSELITVGHPPLPAWVGVEGWLPLRQLSVAARLAEGALRVRAHAEAEAPARFEAAVAAMKAATDARGVRFLVLGLPPHALANAERCAEQAGERNCATALRRLRTLEALSTAAGAAFVSLLPGWQQQPHVDWASAHAADWEHPGPAGQARLGELAAEAIRLR